MSDVKIVLAPEKTLHGSLSGGHALKGSASASPYIPQRMAHKLTFTGAVEAEYDGSVNVSVKIPTGGGATPEDVAEAVESYMAEHPVEEKDPTVPAWAKAEKKPTYTAEEVGAMPADTEIPVVPSKVSAFENDKGYLTAVPAGYAKTEDIPTKPSDIGAQPAGNYATKSEIPTVPTKLSAFTNDAGFVTEDALEDLGGKAYVQNTQPANMEVGEFWYNPDEEPEGGGIDIPDKLPNPHKLTFSGAVNAEYDGSKAVEVVIPQGVGGSSGGGEWGLLAKVVTTEEVGEVEITQTDDGTPFEALDITEFVIFATGRQAATSGYDYANIEINSSGAAWFQNMNLSTSESWCVRGQFIGGDTLLTETARTYAAYNATRALKRFDNADNKLKSVKWVCLNAGLFLAAGATIEVYGVRA